MFYLVAAYTAESDLSAREIFFAVSQIAGVAAPHAFQPAAKGKGKRSLDRFGLLLLRFLCHSPRSCPSTILIPLSCQFVSNLVPLGVSFSESFRLINLGKSLSIYFGVILVCRTFLRE